MYRHLPIVNRLHSARVDGEVELEPPSGQTEHEITMEMNPAYDVVNVGTTTEDEEVGGGRRV